MTDNQIKVLGSLLISYCTIEAMKADNMQRQANGMSMSYTEYEFAVIAEEIESNIASLETPQIGDNR